MPHEAIIKACVETKQIVVGNVVHCHILRSGICPSRIVSNYLLNMYSATCFTLDNGFDCNLVEMVVRTMRKRNVVAWNTMFLWYVKRKRFSKAVSVAIVTFAALIWQPEYLRILVKQIQRIWNFMISMYIQKFFPFKAVDLFLKDVEAEDVVTTDDVILVSAATATSQLQHLECNHVGNSFKGFNGKKERDIVSWNTMGSTLVENELDNEALMLVYETKRLWVAIDDTTITILLSAASNLRDREI
ncbi:hypothetical protein H5410_056689, partial [Solanum commersonii]